MTNWTINGRASVITTDVEVSVLIKEQLTGAIDWLIENDYCFEYDVVAGDSLNPTKYSIRVPEMSWADNLKSFAEVLEQSDYGMENDVL